MMKFEIGDVVWVRAEFCGYHGSRDRLVLEVGNGEVIAVKSDCKTSPEFDIKKAITEVLLSDEFMKAFAAAFRSETVSQYTFSDEVRSLEHPIPGVNRPMRSESQLSQMVEMVRQSWTTETVNSPETLDSSNPLESPKSSSEPTSKPSSTQPPNGHYCDAESIWVDEPSPFEGRIEKDADKSSVSGLVKGLSQAMQKDQDLAWTWHCNIAAGSLDEGVDHKTANLAAARFMSIAFGVDMTTFEEWKRFDWAAYRKIETPVDEPTPWTPKVGERVVLKATGAIYEIESYSETYKQYSMHGWPGSCVNLEEIAPWFETDPPTKRYRDPTQADLANGPIDCEVRNSDGEQWVWRILCRIADGSDLPFRVLRDRLMDSKAKWPQCRIKVAE